MKTPALLLAVLLCCGNTAMAKDKPDLAARNIPHTLSEGANEVMRDYNMHIEMVSLSEISVTEKYTITILNKDGYDQAYAVAWYDKLFHEVNEIKGTLYDKNGVEIRTLKRKDINDQSPYSEFLNFNDYKYKYFDFGYSNYPFTVSYEIHTTLKSSVFLPVFQPQPGNKCAVEKATLEFEYPREAAMRYKTFHLAQQPTVTEAGGVKRIGLSISDIKASKRSELAPEERFERPTVIFASDEFEYNGTKGKMDSWRSFGKFVYDLNAQRDDLPDEMKAVVHRLTDTCASSFSKINVLYEYLKKNTRYVAIETGISGWQCIEAKATAASSYGDCKGLSNYMGAMLKEAGIASYGVLIYGGADDRIKVQKDFPYNDFNHYILCVPRARDTIWMDCTSKYDPTGYLQAFTSGRDALLLTPEGGYVVRTPEQGINENTTNRKATMRVNAKDELDAVLDMDYKGFLGDVERARVTDQPKDKIENHFNEKFSLPGYKITGYNLMPVLDGHIPGIHEEISLKGSCKITHTGKRLFIEPFVLPLNIGIPSNTDTRNQPFEVRPSFVIVDTEIIYLEGSYDADHIPDAVNISETFGTYSLKVSLENNNTLLITRRYRQNNGVYPAEQFASYTAFAKSVNPSHQQIVLIKKE